MTEQERETQVLAEAKALGGKIVNLIARESDFHTGQIALGLVLAWTMTERIRQDAECREWQRELLETVWKQVEMSLAVERGEGETLQ